MEQVAILIVLFEELIVMYELGELENMLNSCDEIVLVHSKEHGGLLQFYSNDYFRGEFYVKCGSLLDMLTNFADSRGNINSNNVNLLKEKLHNMKSMAVA